MYHIYILMSQKDSGYYIGYTSNIEKRIKYHNSGKVKSTKSRRPLQLIYTEKFLLKAQAKDREHELKSHGQKREALLKELRDKYMVPSSSG